MENLTQIKSLTRARATQSRYRNAGCSPLRQRDETRLETAEINEAVEQMRADMADAQPRITEHPTKPGVYRVQSDSHAGVRYDVSVDGCNCPATNANCKHIRAVRLFKAREHLAAQRTMLSVAQTKVREREAFIDELIGCERGSSLIEAFEALDEEIENATIAEVHVSRAMRTVTKLERAK